MYIIIDVEGGLQNAHIIEIDKDEPEVFETLDKAEEAIKQMGNTGEFIILGTVIEPITGIPKYKII